MSNSNSINNALGITPSQQFTTVVSNIISNAKNDSANEDFTYARSNIREVIQNGNEAITNMAQIALQSQNARDYEVLSNLFTTVVNASEKLLRIQKAIRELDHIDLPRDTEQQSITNNLYVGSTKELQDILVNFKKPQA